MTLKEVMSHTSERHNYLSMTALKPNIGLTYSDMREASDYQ
jgi:hypothetical protein